MRILVTGGAGFIGSHLVEAFHNAGHSVAVLDDFSGGKRENLADVPEVPVFEGSITDAQFVKETIAEFKPEIIDHHAAQVSVVRSVQDPQFDTQLNVLGLVNVLEAARSTDSIKKVIMISSAGTIYGDPEVVPCTEDFPKKPGSFYGLSKHVGELYVNMYAELYGLQATVLRYTNVYGPRQDPHGEAGVCAIFSLKMLNNEEPTIFGDGSQIRDYVFIEDVVSANLAALEKGEGEAFNISTAKGTSTMEVFTTLKAATGFPGQPIMGPARSGELQRIIASNQKAKTLLGWEPNYSFTEGIAKTVAWYRSQE